MFLHYKDAPAADVERRLINRMDELIQEGAPDPDEDELIKLRQENYVLWQELKNAEALEERNHQLEEENFLLKENSSAAQGASAENPSDLLALLDLAGGGKPRITPSQCLRLIAAAAPDRVVILPSASESAAKVDQTFTSGDRLLSLLARLVTRYLDAVRSGADVAGIFSFQEYARTESETTMSAATLADRRKFSYRGKTLLMDSHLKIGVAANLRFTLRVYFAYDKPSDRIVIGWCGEHLPV